MTTWSNGDVSGSQTLTDNDHIYPAHINELRVASGVTDANLAAANPYVYDFTYRNTLLNSNFDIWQRGTSFTNPTGGAMTADKWKVNPDPDGGTHPTVIHSRQAITPGELFGSHYFYRLNVDGAGTSLGNSSYYQFYNMRELATWYLCGLNHAGTAQKWTVSFWAKSDIVGKKIGCNLNQTYGIFGSPSASYTMPGETWTLTSTWTKYTHTYTTQDLTGKTFGTDPDSHVLLYPSFWLQWGSTLAGQVGTTGAETFVGAGNIDIAQVQLCAGDTALPFCPQDWMQELDRCKAYYEKSWLYQTAVGTATASNMFEFTGAGGACAIGDYIILQIPFQKEKLAATTVTVYDYLGAAGKVTLRSANSTQTHGITATVTADNSRSFLIVCQTTATTQRGICFHYTADAGY